jgi:hypothetical protein
MISFLYISRKVGVKHGLNLPAPKIINVPIIIVDFEYLTSIPVL